MDPTIQGSTFQNRTVHPCEKVCEIIDDGAQRLCEKYCPESESWEYGWFDMADPDVAYYINAVGRAVFISQLISLDENIGKIFDKLKAENLYDDSVIIFTTDNGANIATYGSSKSLSR